MLFFSFQSQSLARHTTADAGATVSEVLQGLLRCLGGDIPRGGAGIALAYCLCVFISATSLKGAQGLLWRVAMSLPPRCFFIHTHRFDPIKGPILSGTKGITTEGINWLGLESETEAGSCARANNSEMLRKWVYR